MAPSKSGVALAALLLGTALVQAPQGATAAKIVGKTAECLSGLNLARAGRLESKVSILAKQEELETKASQEMSGAGKLFADIAAGCTITQKTPSEMKGFLITKTHDVDTPDDPVTAKDCPQILRGVISAGLTTIQTAEKAAEHFDTAAGTFQDPNAQNFAYVMWSGATKVGCAATQGCKDGSIALFCAFDDMPSDAKPVFTAEFFNALKKREDDQVYITDMKPEEVEQPGGSSSVSAIVPSALIVAATALVGFASM